jgi:response regulator RpfG family c-di-GMP phosphodiesterase
MLRMHPTGNPRLLDQLVRAGLITAEQREAALNVVRSLGERVEEALLDKSLVDETRLLKFIASEHKTRFVSTEKLAKAEIDRATLDKVPLKFAEQRTVFPVMYDAASSTLSVVTPDPDDIEMRQELQLVSGVRTVQSFVARPRAVKAAISRAYNGDIHAFATLDRAAHEQFTTMLNVYERNLVTEETMTNSLARESVARERVLSSEDLVSKHQGREFLSAHGVNLQSYIETLNVLVTLLENGRSELRGHSAQVARLVQKMGERIGLPELERAWFVIGAHIHDLGKMGAFHLTALNVAEYEGHRTAAQKQLMAPVRLFETTRLPRDIDSGVQMMYERFDGKGLPNGVRGQDIPLLSRVLAIADTYADITQNPHNPFRQVLSPPQACDVLKRHAGTLFDSNLVELFRLLMTGDDLKARLLADRHRILIVDTDPEETTVLELQLIEQGFEVKLARSGEQALKILAAGDVSLVVSEIDLDQGDGLALLTEARKHSWGKSLPWIITTSRTGRGDAKRAFELQVTDYLMKPVTLEVFVAKVRQILERQAVNPNRGVSGALSEMGLPEIIQILWHGRKTGRLNVRSGTESGEIHFVGGAVYNALWANQRGEEACYAMLRLSEGEFVLDPTFEAPQKVIVANPEALLLEGMRRLDESTR